MKKLFVFFLILLAVGVTAQTSTTENGLEITVTEQKSADTPPGYVNFLVKAKNTVKEGRSMNGRIVLLSGANEVGGCTVFLALQGGDSKEKVFHCAGSGHTSWKFSVVKVYNFYQD